MRIVQLLPSSTEIVCKLLKYLHEICEEIHSNILQIGEQIQANIDNMEDNEYSIKEQISELHKMAIYDFIPVRMTLSENDNPIQNGYIIQEYPRDIADDQQANFQVMCDTIYVWYICMIQHLYETYV